MNAALYARVSTRDKGQDPEMQLSELREYAAKRGRGTKSDVYRVSMALL